MFSKDFDQMTTTGHDVIPIKPCRQEENDDEAVWTHDKNHVNPIRPQPTRRHDAFNEPEDTKDQ